MKNLGPVEGEGVRWGWILAARAWDVGMGIWVWNRVEGGLTRDGGELMCSCFVELKAFEVGRGLFGGGQRRIDRIGARICRAK